MKNPKLIVPAIPNHRAFGRPPVKIEAGVPVFPDCGCTYSNDDDGISFCSIHAAAEKILSTGSAYIKALDDMRQAEGFVPRIAAALKCHNRLKEFRETHAELEGK